MWADRASEGLNGGVYDGPQPCPQVSIVIRAKNEVEHIGGVLDAVYEQQFKDFEVIFVDSGSTDGTLELVAQYPVILMTIPPESFSFGYSLNAGTERARGEYVAYLSAHALPVDSAWLGNLISPFADPQVGGVYGRQVAHPWHNPFQAWKLSKFFRNDSRTEGTKPFFSNANSCIRRSVWQSVPFCESLTGTEDFLWAKMAQLKGFKIMYQPEASVFHSHEEKLRDAYQRKLRDIQGRCQVYGACATLVERVLRPPVRSWASASAYLLGHEGGRRWILHALAFESVVWWASVVGSTRMVCARLSGYLSGRRRWNGSRPKKGAERCA